MTTPTPWLDATAATEHVTQTHGARPKTDYTQPVACPECGMVRRAGQRSRFCRSCRALGYAVRLCGAAELRWLAEWWRVRDYVNMAAWVEGVAERV